MAPNDFPVSIYILLLIPIMGLVVLSAIVWSSWKYCGMKINPKIVTKALFSGFFLLLLFSLVSSLLSPK